ncbi:TonB-dependent receptor [Aquimarina addita]|uniref:TonB-dependent receptor n=1 Tax=Aquimarina addita TaxID=870485 RepID=A0ABP6URX1_9FLAO
MWSQTGTIEGVVTFNKKKEPYVNVYLSGTNVGTATNEDGRFELTNIPEGSYTLIVSSLGFKVQKKRVTVDEGTSYTFDFQLEADNNNLEEVVISGTMKPVSKLESTVPVEVYSKSFFKKNPTPSVFESLQNVNGVRPQLNCNVCNTGDIHINGLEGPYTFVLIDGMPIVSGLSTVYGLTGIPQSLIERVEIVKGPASTLYGSEAVGGIINIITKKPSSAPETAVESFVSSWGEANVDLGLRYALGDKIQGLLGVNYFNFQNKIDNNNDGFTDLTLQNRISVFNKLNFDRKNNKVFTVAGRYVYEDRWGGDMRWNSRFRGGDEIYGESIYTSRWETFGTYQLPLEENINFQFSANGHIQNSFYGTDSYNADQYIGFGQFTWNKPIGERHDLLVGAAYRYTYYDDNTFATAASDGITNNASITHLPGLFVQDEIRLADQHKLLLGARYDYNSIHGTIFSPRLNYKWNSKDKSDALRFSAGNGFRVANVFTEDHAALTGAREVEFQGELQPETSWNANINYVKKITTPNNVFIGIDASAFYTYFDNRILPDYETDPNKIIYANLDGKSISQGVSVNTDIVWQNGFKVIAGATLMDVSVTENGERRRQLLTESFSGVWSVSYVFKNIGLSVDYTGNVYGPMRLPLLSDTDPRDAYSPWFSVQNIQLTKKMSRNWELYGGVKNLLNFTPAANSIARAFDPFDKEVTFDQNGQAVATPNNPNALTFDPSYVYASNQGIRGFLGVRYTVF